MSALGERTVRIRKVVGSNPVGRTIKKASVINAFRHFYTGFFYHFLLSAFCFAKALLPCLIVFHGVVSQTFMQHERGNIGGLF